MADEGGKEGEIEKKLIHVYPLIRYSDMNDEMRLEALEFSVTACEKFSSNYEHAARVIKETMDKRFGTYWHVIVGEAYGFEVTYETKNILYFYFAGNLAILLWKCS